MALNPSLYDLRSLSWWSSQHGLSDPRMHVLHSSRRRSGAEPGSLRCLFPDSPLGEKGWVRGGEGIGMLGTSGVLKHQLWTRRCKLAAPMARFTWTHRLILFWLWECLKLLNQNASRQACVFSKLTPTPHYLWLSHISESHPDDTARTSVSIWQTLLSGSHYSGEKTSLLIISNY